MMRNLLYILMALFSASFLFAAAAPEYLSYDFEDQSPGCVCNLVLHGKVKTTIGTDGECAVCVADLGDGLAWPDWFGERAIGPMPGERLVFNFSKPVTAIQISATTQLPPVVDAPIHLECWSEADGAGRFVGGVLVDWPASTASPEFANLSFNTGGAALFESCTFTGQSFYVDRLTIVPAEHSRPTR